MKNKTAMMILSAGAGVIAEGLAGAALWWFTSLPVQDVVMIALAVYAAVVCAAMIALDRRYSVRVVSRKRYAKPQIYNLRDYPEWREKDAGRNREG